MAFPFRFGCLGFPILGLTGYWSLILYGGKPERVKQLATVYFKSKTTGQRLNKGDVIVTFRGEKEVFLYGWNQGGYRGDKVIVQSGKDGEREFFMSVFPDIEFDDRAEQDKFGVDRRGRA